MAPHKPRKNKVAGYLRALDLMNKEKKTQIEACKIAGISRMTFNKYKEMLGDKVSETQIEVLPKNGKEAPAPVKSGLDKLIEENAVMEKNLELKRQLGLLQ